MSELGTGLYAGLLVGVPFGPVGALALRYAIKGAFPQVCALAVGTVLAEAAVAIIVAVILAQPWPSGLTYHPAMSFAFAAFLTVVGTKMVLRPLGNSSGSPGSVALGVSQGAGITLVNPGVAAGYFSILLGSRTATWSATGLASLAAGVIATSGAWWLALVPFLRRMIRIGKPDWTLVLVRGIGVVFVLGGIVVAVRTALGYAS